MLRKSFDIFCSIRLNLRNFNIKNNQSVQVLCSQSSKITRDTNFSAKVGLVSVSKCRHSKKYISKNLKAEPAGLMFTIFRECSAAGPGQLDRHLQDGLYHRDPVREVGLLRPQREVQASAHKLRRREDKEGGLVCL